MTTMSEATREQRPGADYARLEERIVARRLEEWRTNMQATVDGIKALAEGSEGADGP